MKTVSLQVEGQKYKKIVLHLDIMVGDLLRVIGPLSVSFEMHFSWQYVLFMDMLFSCQFSDACFALLSQASQRTRFPF